MPKERGAAALFDLVEQTIRAGYPTLRFAAPLEWRYQADTEVRRIHSHQLLGLVGLFLFVTSFPVTMILLEDLSWAEVAAQLLIVVPLGLVHRFALSHWRSEIFREAGGISVVLIVGAIVLYNSLTTDSPFGSVLQHSLILLVMFMTILQGYRFWYALSGVVIVMAVYLAILGTSDRTVQIVLWTGWLMTSISALALLANYRLEREARRSYLIGLKEILRSEALDEQIEDLMQISAMDPLTGVANRRRLESELSAHWADAVRNKTPLALLILDIDHFKQFNDRFGHSAGDRCLFTIAEAASQTIGTRGLFARLGGEEFVAVLPGAGLNAAVLVAESVRMAIHGLAIPNANGGVVTVSIGVASGLPDAASNWHDLLNEADAQLYAAKDNGRDQVGFGQFRAPALQRFSAEDDTPLPLERRA